MISNQFLIEAVDRISEISGVTFSLITADGIRLGANGAVKDSDAKEILKTLDDVSDFETCDGHCYFKVHDANRVEYVLESEASDTAKLAGRLGALQLEALIQANQDRTDKDNFIKNLLLDNLLLVDIYNRAKKLHIEPYKPRVAYLVETKNRDDLSALETVRSMYSGEEQNFVAAIDENNIILVREVREGETEEDLMHVAEVIADMLNTEAMSQVRVSYGNVADEIRKVSNSYKEAKLAMSVGKIFNSEQNVVSYASLGIGRLIYQLPLPMCRMFIEEIFKGNSPESFDEETLTTINQFFENSLNVSETSRQLYIHRNTLVYRLDKLQKNTGLDLRIFDDAITFKIALMVVKYMHYMDSQDK